MLQGEHSAILSTFIKLPFSIKNFVLSIFFSGLALKAGFAVFFILYFDFTATFVANSSLWERLNTGTETYYEDRGLPMHTTYRYRITVYNDVGQMTSDPSPEVTTFGGFPRRSAVVTATAISHLSIGVSWVTPGKCHLPY